MIVSCPACQTQFNVDPALLGSDGRKVRCAKCAHVWRVAPDGAPIPTGQFGLRVPNPAAEEPAAPEIMPEAPADAGIRSALDTPEETEASSTESPEPATEEPSLSAREPIEQEDATEMVSGSDEAADGASGDAAAGQAARPKGGKKFKVFLVLLFLLVLGLITAAVVTGRFGPGGIAPGPQAPSTGDVKAPE